MDGLGAEEKGGLKEQIDQLLKTEPDLKGALAGISVRSAESGKMIYGHMGDTRMRPASNLKLLTAAAAYSVLGEDYTFPTEVMADGARAAGTLKGSLYIKGKGDPTLLTADFQQMAKALRKQGITVIRGDLVGDDSWYDEIRYSQDLSWTDEDAYYGAQISALTVSPNEDYDAGTVIIDVNPAGKTGKKPAVLLTPQTNNVKIKNDAKTVAADGKKDITIKRKHGGNTIQIKGTIPQGASRVRQWVAVWEPSEYALDLFKQALHQQGIRILHDETDVSEIAGMFGGGGHAKAAGCPLTDEAFKLYVTEPFPLEPLRADAFKNVYNVKKSDYGSLYVNRDEDQFFLFPSANGWNIQLNGVAQHETFTSFEEAERFIKRNYAAWLARDEAFVQYLMQQVKLAIQTTG
ncbi:D-alanyl-D-alanine carboxypeptidase/D-alanyl-D-alanine-endopeptidase [Bacillus licheniformis]|nr:D-alanyl-D-alanine carboxypeptidase/D-alanyl-D-alanine-endopeptidase [Bacillus licheniformis]